MNFITSHPLSIIKNIHFLDEIESTNDLAIELSSEVEMHGTLIIAKRQTKARGRQQRSWMTVDGDIAMSLLLTKRFPSKGLHFITITTALAIAESLEKLGIKSFIKWPNDVVILNHHDNQDLPYCGKYRKIAGILTQTLMKASTIKAAVVGVGINIAKKHFLFPDIPHAIGVKDICPDIDREAFLDVFLPIFDAALQKILDEEEHSALMTKYRTRCITLNSRVTIKEEHGKIEGLAIDINEDGALVIMNGSTIHKIYGGEISSKSSLYRDTDLE